MDMILPGGYFCVLTEHSDDLYRRFLTRKVRESGDWSIAPASEGMPLDISIHDQDDEIIAGLSAVTHNDELVIDLFWVHPHYHEDDVGARLARVAEQEALKRHCSHARVRTCGLDFYQQLGYCVEVQATNIVPFMLKAKARRLYTLYKQLA